MQPPDAPSSAASGRSSRPKRRRSSARSATPAPDGPPPCGRRIFRVQTAPAPPPRTGAGAHPMITDTDPQDLTPAGARIEIALLVALTVAAAALRFVDLGALPLGAAGTEEGTSWLVTAGELRHGYP